MKRVLVGIICDESGSKWCVDVGQGEQNKPDLELLEIWYGFSFEELGLGFGGE